MLGGDPAHPWAGWSWVCKNDWDSHEELVSRKSSSMASASVPVFKFLHWLSPMMDYGIRYDTKWNKYFPPQAAFSYDVWFQQQKSNWDSFFSHGLGKTPDKEQHRGRVVCAAHSRREHRSSRQGRPGNAGLCLGRSVAATNHVFVSQWTLGRGGPGSKAGLQTSRLPFKAPQPEAKLQNIPQPLGGGGPNISAWRGHFPNDARIIH